jgi:G:T-mismatch repair DNA endonuclease (very short patch repair protein)
MYVPWRARARVSGSVSPWSHCIYTSTSPAANVPHVPTKRKCNTLRHLSRFGAFVWPGNKRQNQHDAINAIRVDMRGASMIRIHIHEKRITSIPMAILANYLKAIFVTICIHGTAGTIIRSRARRSSTHFFCSILKLNENTVRRSKRASILDSRGRRDDIVVPILSFRSVRRRDCRHLNQRGVRTKHLLQSRSQSFTIC